MNNLPLLLEEIKSYINFTWDDPAKSERIYQYTLNSIQYLNEVANAELDFEEDRLARELLFNRVMYEDSRALNEFNSNYNSMIEELKIKYVPDEENTPV